MDLSGAVWRKSSRSSPTGQCVEVADLGDLIAVRDSKNRGGAALLLTRDCWAAFVADIKAGEFQPPAPNS